MEIWLPRISLQLPFGATHQLLAQKADTAADDLAVAAQKVNQAEGDGAFAAAGLTHQAVGFTLANPEVDPAYGSHIAVPGFIGNGQILHRQ